MGAQGPTKTAQRNKVLADAFKLVYVASQLPVAHRKVLCLSDEEAARPFLGQSWYAGALRAMAVEVEVLPLGDEWRERVLRAPGPAVPLTLSWSSGLFPRVDRARKTPATVCERTDGS